MGVILLKKPPTEMRTVEIRQARRRNWQRKSPHMASRKTMAAFYAPDPFPNSFLLSRRRFLRAAGLVGAIEEISEHEARSQMETNLFGALSVTQAAFPYIGMYHASKWGLEGFSQSLSQEVQPLGIKVTLIEPIGYTTDWSGPSAKFAEPLPAYEGTRDAMAARRASSKPGDPHATGPVVLKLVDMEEPPLRILFGKGANEMIHAEYAKRLAEWDKFKDLSEEAHGV